MTSEATGGAGNAPRYEADPYEARTDLMLEGFGLLKGFVGIALYVGLAFAMIRAPFWSVFLLWLVLVATAMVLLDLAARIVVRRRGRIDERGVARVAWDALAPARRYWFLAILPVIEESRLPFWLKLIVGSAAMVSIQLLVDELVRRFRRGPACWDSRGATDTGAGKASAPP